MPVAPRLNGSYGMAVGIALLGLCPYLVLSTASVPLSDVIAHDLGATRGGLQLVEGMSNAGYACGAVVAAQLAQRFLQRRLFLGYEALFVLGSALAAAAPGIGLFLAGRVLQGAATGLMLISALPPLVTRFGVGRLPLTVAIVNIGLFGAGTAGPIVGGLVASTGAWRALFATAAVLGALGWVVAALGYVRFDPPDPELPVDRAALSLAVGATALTFFATSVLAGASFLSPVFLVPFAVGLAALVALVVVERRKRRPLMPVEALSTQLPVTGTVVAMVAGAVFVTAVELLQLFLDRVAGADPASAGLLFLPMPLGVLVAATAFGVLFRSRYVPLLVNAGLLALVAGSGLLLTLDPAHPDPVVRVATALLGFGAGATVSPGLFMAALGVPSQSLGRAFALVELLRSVAAYAVAPVVAFVVMSQADLASGVRLGLWLTLGLAVLGLGASVAIPVLSGARLRRPDLEAWLEDGDQALASPVTMGHVRRGVQDETAEPLLPEVLRPRR